MSTTILSSVLLILGFYLLVSFLLSVDSKDRELSEDIFTLGCFDSSNHINSSSTIRSKIQLLNQQMKNATPASYKQAKEKFKLKKHFDADVREMATTFKTYLENVYKIKTLNLQENKYLENLQKSYYSFLDCKNNLASSFKQQDCWNLSQQKDQLDKENEEAKRKLNETIKIKKQEEEKIKVYFQFQFEDDEEDFTAQYRLKIEQLNSQLSDLENKQNDENLLLSKSKEELIQTQGMINISLSILDKCVKHKKLIQFCNQITKEIDSIDYGIGEIGIHQTMNQKRMVLEHLQSALSKAKKLKSQYEIDNLQYEIKRIRSQLSYLEEIYLSRAEAYDCSEYHDCEEEHLKSLKKNITVMQEFVRRLSRQIQNSQALLIEYEATKIGFETLKRQLDENLYQKTQESHSTIEEIKKKRQQNLKDYKIKINQYNKLVTDSRIELKRLSSKERQMQFDISLFYSQLEGIEVCLAKKDYYFKLKYAEPEENQNEQRIRLESLRDLVSKLKAIRID